MADRDALIVICWLAIFILIFFECFYRKLKSRFNRDIQAPPRFSSLSSSDGEAITSLSSAEIGSCRVGGSELPHYSSSICSASRRAGTRFSTSLSPPLFPFAKEACRIPMEEGDEEPPPTYEEALSYAKIFRKYQLAPYGFEYGEEDVSKLNETDANHSATSAQRLLQNCTEANVDSDLEDYSTDEDAETESDTALNNNSRNEKNFRCVVTMPAPQIQCTRILSSSTLKIASPPQPLEATTDLQVV